MCVCVFINDRVALSPKHWVFWLTQIILLCPLQSSLRVTGTQYSSSSLLLQRQAGLWAEVWTFLSAMRSRSLPVTQ